MRFIANLRSASANSFIHKITISINHTREGRFELSEISFIQSGFDIDHQVKTLLAQITKLKFPNDFSQPTLTAITRYGATNFACDGDPVPMLGVLVPENES